MTHFTFMYLTLNYYNFILLQLNCSLLLCSGVFVIPEKVCNTTNSVQPYSRVMTCIYSMHGVREKIYSWEANEDSQNR